MNIIAKYVVAFLLIYSGDVASIAESWKGRISSEQLQKLDLMSLANLIKQNENQKTKAEEAREKAKEVGDTDTARKEELKAKQAAYNVATAQSVESAKKQVDAREKHDVKALEEEITKTAVLEKAKKALEGEIQQLMQAQPKELAEVLAIIAPENLSELDRAFENKLKNINQESMSDKQKSIETVKNQLEPVHNDLKKEMGSLWEKPGIRTKAEDARLRNLNSVVKNLETKLARLSEEDAKILDLRAQESSFTKLVRTIKEFFTKILSMLSVPKNEHEISDQINKVTNEVTNFKHQLEPVQDFIAKLKNNRDFLQERADELSAQAKMATTRQEVEELQERARLLNNAITALERSFANLEGVTNLVDDLWTRFDALQERSLEGLALKGFRAPDDTLFDRLLVYYREPFKNINNLDVYAYLGLTSDVSNEAISAALAQKLGLPSHASREALSQKIQELEGKFVPDTTLLRIAKMLNNPISKATYDAFLKDYQSLVKKNVNIQRTSPATKKFLNEEGALSKIEIRQPQILHQIDGLLSDIQPAHDITNLKATFDDMKNQIALAQNALDKKIQSTSALPGGGD